MTRISPGSESRNRLARQIAADSGHAIGLLDGECRNRKIGKVRADQRDVGAVQGGDERQPPPGRRHLLREHAEMECGMA